MKIYGITITFSPNPVKPDLRHDWLVRQYQDCKTVTDKVLTAMRA